jgi:hypothetical protein
MSYNEINNQIKADIFGEKRRGLTRRNQWLPVQILLLEYRAQGWNKLAQVERTGLE